MPRNTGDPGPARQCARQSARVSPAVTAARTPPNLTRIRRVIADAEGVDD
jgi:hypothetical protein